MDEPLLILRDIPAKFFSIDGPRSLREILSGPTLWDLSGDEANCGTLFLSTLLHGNETSGFFVLQKWLKVLFQNKKPRPRLLIFFGNVQAASRGLRQMSGGDDFNRIWDGPLFHRYPWAQMLLEKVKAAKPYFCLDIHNTSGRNPHFSCSVNLSEKHLSMAQIFSDKLFYFKAPTSILNYQLETFSPTLTLECGQSGDREAEKKLEEILNFIIQGKQLFEGTHLQPPGKNSCLQIYECFGKFIINNQNGLHWWKKEAEEGANSLKVGINPLVEDYNFKLLPEGLEIACGGKWGDIIFLDQDLKDISENYIELKQGGWVTKQAFFPAMVSGDLNIISSDCWGYLLRLRNK